MNDEYQSCLRPNYWKHKQHQPGALGTGEKGGINELTACAHFLRLGYEVFRNVCASGKGDIIIWKHGEHPVIIDVKAISATTYVNKDGTERVAKNINRSKYPGVITVGVSESGEVVYESLPKN